MPWSGELLRAKPPARVFLTYPLIGCLFRRKRPVIPEHVDHDSAQTKNLDDILRIGWSTCSGIVVAIFRIHWPPCAGIRNRLQDGAFHSRDDAMYRCYSRIFGSSGASKFIPAVLRRGKPASRNTWSIIF